MKHKIIELVSQFSNENLTQWQKEQQRWDGTAQAKIIGAFCYSIHNQQRFLQTHIAEACSKLAEHLESAHAGSDNHNARTEQSLDYIRCQEETMEALLEIMPALKEAYKEIAGSTWEPYIKQDNSRQKETAARMDALALIQKYKK